MDAELDNPISPDTRRVVEFLTSSQREKLRDAVVEKTKHHIVDTIGAMVSGFALPAGLVASKAAAMFRGANEATMVGSGEKLPVWAAGMINAMLAHADETDDSHERAKFHPGCGIVASAVALAQFKQASGESLIRAVATGYDLGARVLEALGAGQLNRDGHATHAFGSLFGCGGAVGSLMQFDDRRSQTYLSYLAHEVSGLASWMHDSGHVQKAYVFGGMAAKNAIITGQVCEAGWTGSDEVLAGPSGLIKTYASALDRRPFSDPWQLGHEILSSNIKKWCVGSPIQAVLDGLAQCLSDIPTDLSQIQGIEVEIRSDEASVVAARNMPNISLPHLTSLFIVDRALTFSSVHDEIRMNDPRVKELAARVTMIASDALMKGGGRQAHLRIALTDGRVIAHHTAKVRGSWQNPMPRSEVDAKAEELMEQVLGRSRTRRLLNQLWDLEALPAGGLGPVLELAVK